MRAVLITCLACLALVAVTACGSSSGTTASGGAATTSATSSTHTHFAKTKFVLHAGLAFGAFHRYIYKPLKTGAFSGGLLHHKLATLKAALAAAFAYHEVKLALNDARSSRLLSTALSPLLALQTRLQTLSAGLHHGSVDTGAITSANQDASQASAASSKAGQPVTDQPTPAF